MPAQQHTMADPSTTKDAAAKARILSHLNSDHRPSLSYYLRHYNSLSWLEARSPTLIDITFNYLTMRTSWGHTSTIPLHPPLKSWSDARTRTVEMDRVSRAALGISHITIDEYTAPRSVFHVTVFALCVLTLVVFVTKAWYVPGSFVYERVICWWPGGAEWFLWTVRMIAAPVLVLHIGESLHLDRSRLAKYGVERGSGLWLAWMSSALLEGFGAFARFDALVRRKEVEAEKSKH